MSKEKPEVGDVWEDNCNRQVVVIYISPENTVSYIDRFYNKSFCPMSSFKAFKYLGKSKVNIEELFDVE